MSDTTGYTTDIPREDIKAFLNGETNRIARYTDTYEFELEANGSRAFISHFYVAPTARGSGHGSRIMESLLNIARDRGLTYVEVHIQPTPGEVDASAELLSKYDFQYESAGIANPEIDEVLSGRRTL